MAKIIVKNLKSKKAAKKSVLTKRLKGADGSSISLHTLNASAKSFGNTHHVVFVKNVNKARRDNKIAVGTADVVRRKA